MFLFQITSYFSTHLQVSYLTIKYVAAGWNQSSGRKQPETSSPSTINQAQLTINCLWPLFRILGFYVVIYKLTLLKREQISPVLLGRGLKSLPLAQTFTSTKVYQDCSLVP